MAAAALGVKEAGYVLRIGFAAKRRGLAAIFITRNAGHAMTVGDHFAALIKRAKAAELRRGEMTREEIAGLMAEREAEIESHRDADQRLAPSVEELR